AAQGRYEQAESYANRALTAFTRSSPGKQTDLHTPIALDTLGSIKAAQSKLHIAEAYYRRALDWRQEIYDYQFLPPERDVEVISELARSNSLLANVLRRLGDPNADFYAEQASHLLQSMGGTAA